MGITWTPEKIAQLALEEVRQLAKNAKLMGNFEVSALCLADIDSRKIKGKSARSMPEGFVRVEKSPASRKLEHEIVKQLVKFVIEIERKFDFSIEKAITLSESTKRFRPHRLTDSKGKPKVGGAQKAGFVVFDRYISYRIGESVYGLLVMLPAGEDINDVRFHVVGPKEHLTNAVPIAQLRPYLETDAHIGLMRFAEEFHSFDEAAMRFEWLLEKVAPRI